MHGQEQVLQFYISKDPQLSTHQSDTTGSSQMFNGCRAQVYDGALRVQRNVAEGSSMQQQVAIVPAKWLVLSSDFSNSSCLAGLDSQVPHLVIRRSAEESYIHSDASYAPDPHRDFMTQNGPVFPRASILNVDAFYYMQFAKPLGDTMRLRRAHPPVVSTDVLDTSLLRPLMTTGKPTLKHAASRYTCCQHVSSQVLGTEDCLQLVLRMMAMAASEQTY